MPRALVLGSAGQDGTILCRKLTLLGYEVLGVSKYETRSSIDEFDHLAVSICNKNDIFHLVKNSQPDHIYHLAAYQHSSTEVTTDEECDMLQKSIDVNVLSLHYILEAVRIYSDNTAVFYAASSHIYGNTESKQQAEDTPFTPVDYYGISKVAGIHLCKYYREKHELSIACGILYNHESVYRKPQFVSIKIIQGALDILHKKKEELVLGDLTAKIDWGSAHDYVDAMWLLLKNKVSDDFIIATGCQHSVGDFVEIVFHYLGLDARDYVRERGDLVKRNRGNLCGDISKIQGRIGWKPKTPFKKMVLEMTDEYMNEIYVG